MIWKQTIKDLNLPNEPKILELMKRPPADPLIYILKVQDKTGIEAKDYYKILMKKYEEEGNKELFKVASELEYIFRDNCNRTQIY